MKIKMTVLKLAPYEKFSTRDAQQLRGYIANQFQQYSLLHNHHVQTGKNFYRYPLVQYKILNNIATIIGINEGGELIEKIYFDIKKLIIKEKNYIILEKSIANYEEKVEYEKENLYTYKFVTPWIAFNEKNFYQYINLSDVKMKKQLCVKILVGNILSFLKSINMWIEERIILNVDLFEVPVNFKNCRFISFKGSFQCNLSLPNYIGLGKSPAKGFGTIRRVKCFGTNSE